MPGGNGSSGSSARPLRKNNDPTISTAPPAAAKISGAMGSPGQPNRSAEAGKIDAALRGLVRLLARQVARELRSSAAESVERKAMPKAVKDANRRS